MKKRGIAPGTILYGSYVVEHVLGEGGFGITYLAVRQGTGEKVAVKEYVPLHIADRQAETDRIIVSDPEQRADYIRGKKRFIQEASILKEYQYLQGIVRVWDCFEANDTAYIVMDYIDGITLKEYISSHGCIAYMELLEMLSPILKSLMTLHRHGVIHRDISPDNLMIGMDNQLYLIDFGSAREIAGEKMSIAMPALAQGGIMRKIHKSDSDCEKTTTVLLKAGYAPPEQYLHDGELGAWTDVYALCATMYTALCGRIPTNAVARLQGRELVPLSRYDVAVQDWQWEAISKGMQIHASERFRDVEQLYNALTVEPTDEDIPTIYGQEMKRGLRRKFRAVSGTGRTSLLGNRQRALWKPATLLVCVILMAGLYGNHWWKQWQEAGKQGMEADAQANVTRDEEQEMESQEGTERPVSRNTEDNTSEDHLSKVCRMPDVLGMTENEAITAITGEDSKITVSTERVYSEEVTADVVLAQSVQSDTQYNEGGIREVVLTVSKGPEPDTGSTAGVNASSTQEGQGSRTGHSSDEDEFHVIVDEPVTLRLDD